MRTPLKVSTPILLAAGIALSGAAFGQTRGLPCKGVEIGSVPESKSSAATPSFVVSQIEDLEFRVLFTLPPPGEHLLTLRLLTPRRHLYQVVDVPFSLDPRRTARKEVAVSGYPRPVAVKAVEKRAEGQGWRWGVSATLPVAGTLVVENSLYGTWQVEPYIDGETIPCVAPVSFDLAP